MTFRTIALAAAAVSLAATPTLAQVAFERSTAPVEGESELQGGAGLLFGLLGAAAVIGAVVVAASDDDDSPTSP